MPRTSHIRRACQRALGLVFTCLLLSFIIDFDSVITLMYDVIGFGDDVTTGCDPAIKRERGLVHRDEFFLHHMFVDETSKTMLCVIPKSSFIFWTTLNQHVKRRVKLTRLAKYTERERLFRLSTYKKGVLTREPMSRLWSAYNDKFVHPIGTFRVRHSKKIRQANNQDEADLCGAVSFSEFVNYVISQQIEPPMEEHWETYDRICRPCDVEYTHVGKMENFTHDFEPIRRDMGIKTKLKEYSSTQRMAYQLKRSSEIYEDMCFKPSQYSEALWNSLKGTGHLNKISKIPEELQATEADLRNVTTLVQYRRKILDYIVKGLPSDEIQIAEIIKPRKKKWIETEFKRLTRKQRCKLLQIYARDYLKYGYRIPDFLSCK